MCRSVSQRTGRQGQKIVELYYDSCNSLYFSDQPTWHHPSHDTQVINIILAWIEESDSPYTLFLKKTYWKVGLWVKHLFPEGKSTFRDKGTILGHRQLVWDRPPFFFDIVDILDSLDTVTTSAVAGQLLLSPYKTSCTLHLAWNCDAISAQAK